MMDNRKGTKRKLVQKKKKERKLVQKSSKKKIRKTDIGRKMRW